jgi:hypothetical protein
MTVEELLLAGAGPPASGLRCGDRAARIAFEVVDKLAEHVEMVARFVRIAVRRWIGPVHRVRSFRKLIA